MANIGPKTHAEECLRGRIAVAFPKTHVRACLRGWMVADGTKSHVRACLRGGLALVGLRPQARACLGGWNPVVLRLGTGFLSSAAAGGGQLCHNSSVRHVTSQLEEPV